MGAGGNIVQPILRTVHLAAWKGDAVILNHEIKAPRGESHKIERPRFLSQWSKLCNLGCLFGFVEASVNFFFHLFLC